MRNAGFSQLCCMPKPLDIIRNTRKRLSEMADGHTLEQLNRIPEKYNNNLAWNLGHVVASQQVLCYELSALPPTAVRLRTPF